MTLQARIIILVSFVLFVSGCVWYAASQYYKPAPEAIDAAPAIKQDDGSTVLERNPGVKPPRPHKVPGKPVRDVSITVQPKQEECDPVTVDLTLYEDGKGGKRVVASSPDGTVIDGVDIPATDLAGHLEAKRNRIGIAYQPRGYAVTASRDYGPLSIGVMVTKRKGEDAQPWIKAEFAF